MAEGEHLPAGGPSDRIFDGMEPFLDRIYGSTKGDVRLHVLWHDLLAEIPSLKEGGLRVIDVGAGKGQIAKRAAELGNEVTFCDPSAEMLEEAREGLRQVGLAGATHFVHSKAQELDAHALGQFDLVMCHAVLEWLAEPRATLAGLLPLLSAGGFLSLMFWNRNAAILKRALRGDLRAVGAETDTPLANREGATPLDPDAVQSWLTESGLRVVSRSGIRIFHDLLPENVGKVADQGELLEIETKFRRREPFASLGQHIHLVCTRA